MQFIPYKTRVLTPPKDDLFEAIKSAKLNIKDGDVIVVSSKVVSIGEGRCLPFKNQAQKDRLAKGEADYFVDIRRSSVWKSLFTVTEGVLIGRAGIDESNGKGHLILYPKNPMKSADTLRKWFQKTYSVKKLGVIISDSRSTPLRRGAIGFALGWAGIVPLKDYRKTKDLFGRAFQVEIANIADGLAGGAVVAMGEGNEQTPIVVIRNAPVVFTEKKRPQERIVKVKLENDLFSPFLLKLKWKKGGGRD
ncbi:MAG: coenzyme F420-0:L-glutamate ligase [Patescibacteria group bacterium]